MSAWTWFGAGIAVAGVLAACSGGGAKGQGSTTGAEGGATGTNGAGGSPLDDGGTGGTSPEGGTVPYPAPHGTYPVVVSGGTTMTTPKVVTVSFPGDPLEADIDAFATAMGKTTYWGDVVKEYGIGPLTPVARIHSTFAPPAMFSDSDLQTWLVSQLDGTHPEWPAPDGNTVYALYFPPGVTISDGMGESCTDFHGYHANTSLPDGTPVVYSMISRCDSIPEVPGATGIQYVSAVASHEVIEAITDPQVLSNTPGYFETDDDHIVWSFLGLAELGDLCSLVGNAFYTPTDFPYLVQRIFSNATAPTGHDPCFPEPAGQVYFNTAPVLNDKISFNYEGYAGTTKGVQIPVGETKTVELDLFSEGPTAGPWKVAVVEEGSSLDLSLDKSSGQNGDKLQLTIHVKSKNTTFGAEIFIVESVLGSQKTLWVGMVGN